MLWQSVIWITLKMSMILMDTGQGILSLPTLQKNSISWKKQMSGSLQAGLAEMNL
jgi:hypothetical protein